MLLVEFMHNDTYWARLLIFRLQTQNWSDKTSPCPKARYPNLSNNDFELCGVIHRLGAAKKFKTLCRQFRRVYPNMRMMFYCVLSLGLSVMPCAPSNYILRSLGTRLSAS